MVATVAGAELISLSHVYRELTREHDTTVVPPSPGRWLVFPTTRERKRVYVRNDDGDRQPAGAAFDWMPWPSDITSHKYLPLPDGGAYFVMYGGGCEIFDNDDVVKKTQTLLEELPGRIADILCVQRRGRGSGSTDQPLTLWTVRGAGGITRARMANSDRSAFPAAEAFCRSGAWAPALTETPKEAT